MTWEIEHGHSSVRWAAKWNGLLNIHGPFRGFQVQLGLDDNDPIAGSVEAIVEAPSFDSSIFRMNARLLSEVYLDAYKFPQIQFKSTEIRKGEGAEFGIIGDLTMREATKSVELATTYNGEMTNRQGQLTRGYSGVVEITWRDFLNGSPPGQTQDAAGPTVNVYVEMLAVRH